MDRTYNLKLAMAGLLVAGVLAIGATAQAVTLDAGVLTANPVVINVPDPGSAGGSGLFLDTINFDLGSFTHFNMTSVANGITAFGSTIFQNDTDGEISQARFPGDTNFPVPGYPGDGAASFTSLALPDLGLTRDYHLHPQGLAPAGVGYTLTLWGSNGSGGPVVPIPAAAWLFGSGLIGLAGLARRKMAV